jgi:hypothetical protein
VIIIKCIGAKIESEGELNCGKSLSNMQASCRIVRQQFFSTAVAATAPQHCVSLLGFFGAGVRFPLCHSLYDSIDLCNRKGIVQYAALTCGLVSFLVFPDLASVAMKSQTSAIALTGGGSGDCCSFLEILPCFMMKNRLSSKRFVRIAHN